MKKDIIISIDIGGTTFESAILDRDYLNIIDMSSKVIIDFRLYIVREIEFEFNQNNVHSTMYIITL